MRRRTRKERLTAAPCCPSEPNRETTAGRDPLWRHAHVFAAAAPSGYPSTRPHLVDTAITTRRVWRGRTVLPTSLRESRLSGQGCPARRKPMTGGVPSQGCPK